MDLKEMALARNCHVSVVDIKPLPSVMACLLAELIAQEWSLLSTMNELGTGLLVLLWPVDSMAALGNSHCERKCSSREFCFCFIKKLNILTNS